MLVSAPPRVPPLQRNAGTTPRASRRPWLAAANRTTVQTERDFGDLAASWGDPRHTVVLFLELLGPTVFSFRLIILIILAPRTRVALRLTIHVRSSDLYRMNPHTRGSLLGSAVERCVHATNSMLHDHIQLRTCSSTSFRQCRPWSAKPHERVGKHDAVLSTCMLGGPHEHEDGADLWPFKIRVAVEAQCHRRRSSVYHPRPGCFGCFLLIPTRIASGVISTNSPSTMYSTASSRVMTFGG